MPTTADRPDGRPAGPEDPFEVAEAAHPAARETVPGATPRRPRDRPVDRSAARATERVDRRHGTPPDRRAGAGRHTVKLPGQRRPPRTAPAGRPLLVAAGFATLLGRAARRTCRSPPSSAWPARWRAPADSAAPRTPALAGWLLGHGVPIGTSIGPLGLAPLLLTLLVVWRLNRAGLHVTRAIGARRTGSPAGRAAGRRRRSASGTRCSASLAALVVDGPGTEVSVFRAGAHLLRARRRRRAGRRGRCAAPTRSACSPAGIPRRCGTACAPAWWPRC